MGFPPCLSRKRPSHGLGGSARDGLYPLPVKEKAVSWTWSALAGGFPRGPGRPPEVPGELSRPKSTCFVNKCSTKVVVFGTGLKLYILALGRGRPPGDSRRPPDLLSTLPVEAKSISGLSGSAYDGLFHLPVEEKTMSGLPQSQSPLWG